MQKQQEQQKQIRKSDAIAKFISEGRQAQRDFAISKRCGDFNSEESDYVFWGVIAQAIKDGISLSCKQGIESATNRFLDGVNWSGMTASREQTCRKWTNLFTARDCNFSEEAVSTFIDFIDHCSCSQDTYQSLMGSNGCADPLGHQGRFACKELTKWDGTQKQVLGAAPTRKQGGSVRR